MEREVKEEQEKKNILAQRIPECHTGPQSKAPKLVYLSMKSLKRKKKDVG